MASVLLLRARPTKIVFDSWSVSYSRQKHLLSVTSKATVIGLVNAAALRCVSGKMKVNKRTIQLGDYRGGSPIFEGQQEVKLTKDIDMDFGSHAGILYIRAVARDGSVKKLKVKTAVVNVD